MTDITIPAPVQVTPEVTDPAKASAAAETVTSAEAVPPKAEQPAGTDQPAAADAVKAEGEQEKQLSPGEQKRKERNRQRWREMNQRLAFAEAELRRRASVKEPDYSQIADPNEELAERTAHKVMQSQTAADARRLEAERGAERNAMLEAWSEAVEEAKTRLHDFDQVFTSTVPIHPRAERFIVESDMGPDIAYWLAKNPKAAVELHDQFESDPARAIMKLGRLEAQLSHPPPKPASTAPKPASIITGGANPLAFDAAKASVSDVEAHLRKAGIIR